MRVASRMRPEGRALITAPTYGPEVITDFSAGTNGAVVDATTLNASTFGINSSAWSVRSPESNLTYATAAKAPTIGTMPAQSVNPWPGDIGTVGMNLLTDATLRMGTFTFPGTPADVVTASVWIKTDYPSNVAPNFDIFMMYSLVDGNFVNTILSGNGSSLRFGAEFASGGTDQTGSNVLISRNTWYLVMMRYSKQADVRAAVRVYDTSLAQVGNEQSIQPVRPGGVGQLHIGYAGGPGAQYGYNIMFSNLTISYESNCRWPLLPLVG